MTNYSFAGLLPWAIGLTVSFPLLLVIFSELGTYAERAGWPVASTIKGVRQIIVPMLALMLFMRHVLEWPADDTFVQLIGTLLWIFILYESLNFINQVVFDAAKEGSWQSRVPTLFRDITRFLLVGIGAALIYSEVWGKEIGAAWTALGLGSVVIGLALQEPLGNIVSGLILLAERPLALGDWITTDGVTGKVVGINWRSVHILTPSSELRIVPNSGLYRGSISNLSRPDLTRTVSLELRFSYEVPPTRVKTNLLDLMQSIPLILTNPKPSVVVANYEGFAIIYNVTFTVARQEDIGSAKDIFLSQVWYVSRREQLNIPDIREPETTSVLPIDLLQKIPKFQINEQLKQVLAPKVLLRRYGSGETIIHEGGPLKGLYVLHFGKAILSTKDHEGVVHEIGQVGPGDFFGENAMLAGQPSDFTVTATEDVELFIIGPDALQELLESAPTLVREIGYMLDVRRKAVKEVRSLNSHMNAPGTLSNIRGELLHIARSKGSGLQASK
ncbi:MAG: cyclic nucleotide-binding domain-containing protein [Candidatus Methylumidiphilus sp.]